MCGVLGVVLCDELHERSSELAMSMLQRLQHRGQDAAGVTVLPKTGGFSWSKGLGHVAEALKTWGDLPPAKAFVGHTRYATTGKGGVAMVQPFVSGTPRLAMAHNGNIVNTLELKEKYEIVTDSDSDLAVLQQYFMHFEEKLGFEQALENLFKSFIGAYAVVGLTEAGEMFAFRDPHGIRPLFMYRSQHMTAFASETSALQFLKEYEREIGLPESESELVEIDAGAWVKISKDGDFSQGQIKVPGFKKTFCMFEMVYFSSPQSEYQGHSAYRYRFTMGQVLGRKILHELPANQDPRDVFDYVVPVPDTSRSAAIAVAETLGVPYREYLVKNPYAARTFILANQKSRIKALESKLSLIGPEVKGQKILLVDDSVVRGNTSRLMAKRLKEAGALEISMASACPPIRHGCFYGIDFPDEDELIAAKGISAEVVAEKIGLKSVYYLDIPGLKRALDSEELCTGCLDGHAESTKEAFAQFLDRRREQRIADAQT